MIKLYWALLVGLTWLLCATSWAQEQQSSASCDANGLCCGTDPSPAGVMISHVHEKNEWMVSYRFMNMNMQGMIHGRSSVSDATILSLYQAVPREMRMNMHMLMLMYGLSDRLTIMSMFHYNSNWMSMSMRMGDNYHRHTMQSSGLGDVRLSALYALLKKSNQQVVFSMGVSFPTGSVQLKGKPGSMMYPSNHLPYSMQTGSGSFDFLPGLSYLFQKNRWYYCVQVHANVRSTTNRVGYRLGHEYVAGSWIAWRWISFLSNSLRLDVTHTGPLHGSDSSLDQNLEPAADVKNYGGTRFNTYAGLVLQPDKGFLSSSKFSIEFGLPVYQNFQGYQMKNTYHLLFTYNLNF